jgi:3-dehydro-L-gulonate 2-dehydrogenase
LIKISFNTLRETLKLKLLKYGFEESEAGLCSKILSENNLYGVASHGTNRFCSFISLIKSGHIVVKTKPVLFKSFGAWEQWDAQKGPGPLNAWTATDRAINLSKENGIGVVTLKNSNHWMRAGTYGWKAAEEGFIMIAWTNAFPMMPPWGSKQAVLGNNPITFAVPRKTGPVVLDMALSQYSYGQLSNYRRENKPLPYAGGYDLYGNLTTDAGEIYESKRTLPIGYWKGSGLAIMIDLVSTILSGGNSTLDIGMSEHDTAMSQVFIVFDPSKTNTAESINAIANSIIDSVKSSEPAEQSEIVLYPGERALNRKNEYLKSGIPVDETVWERILKL